MKKSTIIVLIIVLLAAGAYFYFTGGTSTEDSALQVQRNPEVEVRAARVLTLLTQIRDLEINPAIFKSVEYQTLRDYTVIIPPQDVGRLNPFAPIPGLQGPAVTPSPTATPKRR